MKIIYMGTPVLAIPVLEALWNSSHDVCLVVTQPDRPKGRGQKPEAPPVKLKALEYGINIEQPTSLKDSAFIETLQNQNADLIVVVAFSILPMSVINTARLGAVNLHASSLPKYRGAAPIQWAIYHGDKTTGATIFMLDAKMDNGKILGHKTVPIIDTDTSVSLGDKIIEVGKNLMVEVLDALESGTAKFLEQDHNQATPARKLQKQDGLINWNRSAQELHNQIRAFNPYPICFSTFKELNQKVLRIHEAEVTNITSTIAGSLLVSETGELLVGCSDYFLKLKTVQAEGKPKTDSRSFVNGIQSHTSLPKLTPKD